MSDKGKSLEIAWEKAWEKRADNFQEIDARLPQDEKESEHFKSGLPPKPPKLDGVKKLKKQPSALDRKENRDKQRKFYQDNRNEQIQRKREERRNQSKRANESKAVNAAILEATYWSE